MVGLRAARGLAFVLALASCRSKSSDPATQGAGSDGGRAAGGSTATDDADGASTSDSELALAGDGGSRFRDAEPRVTVDPDGPVDPACTGAEIALDVAVVDKRCAISSARAKQLRATLERDGGPPVPLRQEAKIGADGRITFRLVSTGAAPLTLPLSFAAKLPAFTVVAEDERHTLYELEAPRFDVGAARTTDRAHFARIVLPPGGAAVATLTITPRAVRILGHGADRCGDASPDAAGCAPPRLAKGHYTLHIGELLTDIEVGVPAGVAWDLP